MPQRVAGSKEKLVFGIASNNGFSVTMGEKTAKSANYQEMEDKIKFGIKHKVILAAIMILYNFVWIFPPYYTSELSTFWILFVAAVNFVPCMIMVFFIFYSEFLGKNVPGYHACEHKVIALVKSGLQPTIENLRKMPRISIWCGSYKLGLIGIMPLTLGIPYLILAIITKSFPEINTIITILMMLLSLCLSFILPFLLQFVFAAREPSEEKLEEALEVAKEFYK